MEWKKILRQEGMHGEAEKGDQKDMNAGNGKFNH
jgi:hypothetical protein